MEEYRETENEGNPTCYRDKCRNRHAVTIDSWGVVTVITVMVD